MITGLEKLYCKPAWSVLSLKDLAEKIRQGQQPDDPWRVHESAQRAKREEARTSELRQQQADDRARALRDQYRNAWESS
jgi:hypothetical protein